MYFINNRIIFFLAGFIPAVLACEGECIVQITKVFLGNYSTPIHAAFQVMADQISEELLPPAHRPANTMELVQPILNAYAQESYNSLETAIFPSYFHGKCQRFSKDDQDPPGCPNPDCPVVCGTPGSLVHFYSTLRYIAFNNTKVTLQSLTTPGNPAYNQVNVLVKSAHDAALRKRDYAPAAHGMGSLLGSSTGLGRRFHARQLGTMRPNHFESGLLSRSTPATLASILAQWDTLIERECGGNARDAVGALPRCSWEAQMKEYILTFPPIRA